jgi:Pyruvate/2-oxoacid:ferredoxin oxidoreductase delta subunit
MCPNDAELIQRVRQILSSGNDTINFVCNAAIDAAGKSLDQSKAIDVICLSRIEESLLCTCMVAGAKRIDLVRDQCEGCARQQSVATIDIVKETMDALMSAWGVKQQLVLRSSSSTDIFITEKSGEGGRGLSRREFLAELGHRAKTATTIAATTALKDVNGQTAQVKPQSIATTSVMKDGTLPHFIPNRRERLLDQLDALGSPIADNIDTRLWGHIILDNDRCSSCRMCATFCPTGAIYKFDDIDGTFGIEHYMADCVHCCLCEDICPERAIACINTVPIKDLVEGKIERHIMKPRTWQPNKGDSIWRKMQQVIPNANINERC